MFESLLELKKYQIKYNNKFNTNYIFDGSINYNKILSGYAVWIRLIVYDNYKIIYDYSKEFVLDKISMKNKNTQKSLFMDKYEFIDIIDDLLLLENNLIIIKDQDIFTEMNMI